MNAPCRDFRLLLEGRLAGRAASERLADLAWHEHLFGCDACRAILDAEEALELLLASLPEPRLAPALRERVLARLRLTREEERLDRLLDVDVLRAAPPDLARNVLRGLAARVADERLDRLLELDVVAAPADLASRTLASLRLARRAPARRKVALRVAAVFAAAAALVAVAWFARDEDRARDSATPVIVSEPGHGPSRVVQAVPDEMLASLDVLLDWDVLVSEDIETLLSTLGPEAMALLEDLEDDG